VFFALVYFLLRRFVPLVACSSDHLRDVPAVRGTNAGRVGTGRVSEAACAQRAVLNQTYRGDPR
jgi:hypothetical protein